MVNALGIDPGLANCGWAQMALNGAVTVEACGVITTEPAKKKAGIHTAHDIIRRVEYLYRELYSLAGSVDLICIEGISIPRNSSATLKLGTAFGAITALAARLGVPLLQASTKEVRDALGGWTGAGKDPRIEHVKRRYPGILDGLNLSHLEHAADAIGVVLALQHDPVVLAMRRMREFPPDRGAA